jgi:hypothetical protein
LLEKGNFSELDAAAQDYDAGLLWFYLLSTNHYSANEHDKKVHEYTKRLLAQIPGHTQGIIDRIEQAAEYTKDIRMNQTRGIAGLEKNPANEKELKAWEDLARRATITSEREFTELDQVGSPESVQTLMTYLNDGRRVGLVGAGSKDEYWQPDSNSYRAARSLCRALKEDNPAKDIMTYWGSMPNGFEPVRQRFKSWWLSDASKKWRTPIVKTTRSHLLPGSSGAPPESTSPVTAVANSEREAIWPILVILCLVALAAILGFAKLRRGE